MQIWQAVMACNLRSTNSDSIVWTISTVQQQLFSLSFFFREHTELAGQTIGAFLEKVCSLVTTPPGDYTIFFTDCTPYSDCNNLYEKITSFWLAENECILI